MPEGRFACVGILATALCAFGDPGPKPGKSEPVSAPKVEPLFPADSTLRLCADPLETAGECWRSSTQWANMEIGFPGARSSMLSLSTLEPVAAETFFHAAYSESPYGMGGFLPFQRVTGRNGPQETWAPVAPVDTPVTSLHWTRGALGLNQFTLNLQRMVGNRAYFSLQYHSDRADSQFYDYAFNVHQPYLSGWGFLGQLHGPIDRDSASLVIQDTAHSIAATHMRPRLGFWLGPRTVVEGFVDWSENTSSLTRPTNPAQNDSTQSLYPASFSALSLGAAVSHKTGGHLFHTSFRHASWSRDLKPGRIGAEEEAEGMRDGLETEGYFAWPARPKLRLTLENALHRDAFFLAPGSASPAEEAWSDRQVVELGVNRDWGPLSLSWTESGERRSRPDGKLEWLWGGEGLLKMDLPFGFRVFGEAGWKREGASENALFRLQPALGLYPNPGLKPRSVLRLNAGSGWHGRHLGAEVSWDRGQYADNWLPKVLPDGRDTARIPDSLALALANYEEEIRDLLHLSLYLNLGRWKLALYHTDLLHNALSDSRGISTEENHLLPKSVYKGQLLWRRVVLGGKLGLQTQWDWEWFSARHTFASDLDGFSRVVKLDEYLVLDFTARMEVKSFLLYFRAMNLNHDRYATEPGVHPPGVNFRFGVDWRLWN